MSRDSWDLIDPDDSARMRDKLLRRQVRFQLYPYSPFFRKILDAAGIRADGISGISDLEKLPMTDRHLFSEAHDDFVLKPTIRAIRRWSSAGQLYRGAIDRLLRGIDYAGKELGNEYEPVHVIETSGTTGEPIPIQLTRHDLSVLATQGKRALEVAGVNESDVVLNLLEPTASGAFWPFWLGGVALGLRQVAPGPLGISEALKWSMRSKPTVLVARSEEALGLIGAEVLPDVRLVVTAPEPISAELRRRIMETRTSAKIVSTYRFAEGRTIWAECLEGSGYPDAGFHLSPDFDLVEAVSPWTGQPSSAGEPIEIVFTGLVQRGTALARYRTGDIAKGGIASGRCQYCGRIVDRIIGPIVRSTNLLQIRLPETDPVHVDVEVLAEALAHPALNSWQVEIAKEDKDPRGSDEVFVHFTPKENRDPALVAVEIDRVLRTTIGLSPTQLVLTENAGGGIVDKRPVAVRNPRFVGDGAGEATHVRLWRTPED